MENLLVRVCLASQSPAAASLLPLLGATPTTPPSTPQSFVSHHLHVRCRRSLLRSETSTTSPRPPPTQNTHSSISSCFFLFLVPIFCPSLSFPLPFSISSFCRSFPCRHLSRPPLCLDLVALASALHSFSSPLSLALTLHARLLGPALPRRRIPPVHRDSPAYLVRPASRCRESLPASTRHEMLA